MNISPILLLSIGSTFAFLYGSIITIGWAVTRYNRKKYHYAYGLSKIKLFDLQKEQPMEDFVNTFSLINNSFIDTNGKRILIENFNCYIAATETTKYPKIKKGNLILINKDNDLIAYAFELPSLRDYR